MGDFLSRPRLTDWTHLGVIDMLDGQVYPQLVRSDLESPCAGRKLFECEEHDDGQDAIDVPSELVHERDVHRLRVVTEPVAKVDLLQDFLAIMLKDGA